MEFDIALAGPAVYMSDGTMGITIKIWASPTPNEISNQVQIATVCNPNTLEAKVCKENRNENYL
jgi:hypothetical protein